MSVAVLRHLRVQEGTLCAEGMNPRAKIQLFKMRREEGAGGNEMPKGKTKPVAKQGEGEPTTTPDETVLASLPDEAREQIAQLLASKDEMIAQLQQAKAGEGEGEEDKNKSGDGEEEEEEEGVEASKASKARVSKAEKQIEELQKQLADQQRLMKRRDAIEKAKSFDAIPVPTEQIADLMLAVEGANKAMAPALDQVLRACNELAKANATITKSLGMSNGRALPTTAAGEIEAAIAKAKEADPKLTTAKARAMVYKANPALYAKQREEADRAAGR